MCFFKDVSRKEHSEYLDSSGQAKDIREGVATDLVGVRFGPGVSRPTFLLPTSQRDFDLERFTYRLSKGDYRL